MQTPPMLFGTDSSPTFRHWSQHHSRTEVRAYERPVQASRAGLSRRSKQGGVMRPCPPAVLLTSAAALLSACADRSPTESGDRPSFGVSARVGLGAPSETIDFSSFGSSKDFEPDFFRLDGILFPPE